MMKPRFVLRDAILTIVLIALITVVTIQGWKIAELESRVIRLQQRNAQFNTANVQAANTVNKLSLAWQKDYIELRRMVDALKKQYSPSTAEPMR